MSRGKLAFVITARASYAKLQQVLAHLAPDDYTVYLASGALLDRFGDLRKVLTDDTLDVRTIWSHVEGPDPVSAAHSAALLLTHLATAFDRDRPRAVVVMADRSEVLAAAQAAAYLNIPLVHLQGGEVTGNIDDLCRNAISALANHHYVATVGAGFRVYGLTGSPHIHVTGCPSIDVARLAQLTGPVTATELSGKGYVIDPIRSPFALCLQHADTREWESSYQQMTETLTALRLNGIRTVIQWPNQDPGHEGIAKAIRTYIAQHLDVPFRTIPNLPPRRFLRLLSQAAVLIGNSSAGIREASYLGTPVVNVGARQAGRQRADNVLDVPAGAGVREIETALIRQLAHGPYPMTTLYGDGLAGERIARLLETL